MYPESHQKLKELFRKTSPKIDFASFRYVRTIRESMTVKTNVLAPLHWGLDEGVMVTVSHNEGVGYAATADLTEAGLCKAWQLALNWAQASRGKLVYSPKAILRNTQQGSFGHAFDEGLQQLPYAHTYERLMRISQTLSTYKSKGICDWGSSIESWKTAQIYLDNLDSEIMQYRSFILPEIYAVAASERGSETRSLGGNNLCLQGDVLLLDTIGFDEIAPKIAEESLELLNADVCPNANMSLLLDPDQMILQIHETIGHPLELDRILGDERNYAGTSFVTKEMFGTYQYGSKLLNVVFDPGSPTEVGTYAFDDEGMQTSREFVIKDGLLVRGIGGQLSTVRSGITSMANSRACSWNRPPIDRMANLNVLAGTKSLQELISQIEQGIFMKTNSSWSIDDSRNKFQFGCEWGQLIENGQLTKVVRKPNYRGISADFWRNLVGIGDQNTFKVYGTPFCGKGEPNQVIDVGHASPPCLFSNVAVFGGDA